MSLPTKVGVGTLCPLPAAVPAIALRPAPEVEQAFSDGFVSTLTTA